MHFNRWSFPATLMKSGHDSISCYKAIPRHCSVKPSSVFRLLRCFGELITRTKSKELRFVKFHPNIATSRQIFAVNVNSKIMYKIAKGVLSCARIWHVSSERPQSCMKDYSPPIILKISPNIPCKGFLR